MGSLVRFQLSPPTQNTHKILWVFLFFCRIYWRLSSIRHTLGTNSSPGAKKGWGASLRSDSPSFFFTRTGGNSFFRLRAIDYERSLRADSGARPFLAGLRPKAWVLVSVPSRRLRPMAAARLYFFRAEHRKKSPPGSIPILTSLHSATTFLKSRASFFQKTIDFLPKCDIIGAGKLITCTRRCFFRHSLEWFNLEVFYFLNILTFSQFSRAGAECSKTFFLIFSTSRAETSFRG